MITGGVVGFATLMIVAFRHSFLPRPKISPDNSQSPTQSSLSNQPYHEVPAVNPEPKSQFPYRVPASLSKPAETLPRPSRTPARYSADHHQDATVTFNRASPTRYPLRRISAPTISHTWPANGDAKTPQSLPKHPSSPQLEHALSSAESSDAQTSKIPCENLGGEDTANTIPAPPSPRENTRIGGDTTKDQSIVQTQLNPSSDKINPSQRAPDSQTATSQTTQNQPITSDQLINNELLSSTDTPGTNPCHLKQPAGKN